MAKGVEGRFAPTSLIINYYFFISLLLPLVFPNQPYMLGGFLKIFALAVAFAGDAATGGANIIALGIYYNIEIVAAVTGKLVHFFSIVFVQVYFGRRVPNCLFLNRINPALNTAGYRRGF
jgi:hypothetical protein